MSEFKTQVRMPDGRFLTADIGGFTGTGHRFASVRISREGISRRVAGRITTRHGYDKPVRFEVKLTSTNAFDAFEGTDSYAG